MPELASFRPNPPRYRHSMLEPSLALLDAQREGAVGYKLIAFSSIIIAAVGRVEDSLQGERPWRSM
jgi:hypothetical protein